MNFLLYVIYILIENRMKSYILFYVIYNILIDVKIIFFFILLDNIHTKLDLIEYCVKNKINIISSTGAGAKWYIYIHKYYKFLLNFLFLLFIINLIACIF